MAVKAPIHQIYSPIRCSAVNAPILKCFAPSVSSRSASGLSRTTKAKVQEQSKKKKKRTEYKNQNLRDGLQFSLCDAMR